MQAHRFLRSVSESLSCTQLGENMAISRSGRFIQSHTVKQALTVFPAALSVAVFKEHLPEIFWSELISSQKPFYVPGLAPKLSWILVSNLPRYQNLGLFVRIWLIGTVLCMYMMNSRFQFAYLVKCAQFIKYCTPSEKMFDYLPHVIYSAKAHSALRCTQRKCSFISRIT